MVFFSSGTFMAPGPPDATNTWRSPFDIYTEEHDALIKPLLDLRLKRPPYSYGTGIGDKQVAEWIDDAEKKFNEISKISST